MPSALANWPIITRRGRRRRNAMVDLIPRTDFYTKPQSMGDLLNTMQGIQNYQRQQAVTDTLSDPEVVDRETGMINMPKFMEKYQAHPGFKSPADITAATQASRGMFEYRAAMFNEAGNA